MCSLINHDCCTIIGQPLNLLQQILCQLQYNHELYYLSERRSTHIVSRVCETKHMGLKLVKINR